MASGSAALSSEPTIVSFLDGGLGTSLEDKYELRFDHTTPLWSSHLLVSDQATLLACQKDFADVPVDIVLTATYQISVHGFAATRTASFPDGIPRESISPFVRDAVRIAREATRSDGAKVALSIGPYGACMVPSQEYSGRYDADHDSLEALRAWHSDRLRLFADADAFASVGYVALETLPRIDEIVALRQALDQTRVLSAGGDVPFWISCLYPGEKDALPDGSSVKEAVAAMLDTRTANSVPWGIGINCTKIWKLDSLVIAYEDAISELLQTGIISSSPPTLLLYPDGTNGEVYNTTRQTWEMPEGVDLPQVPWEDELAGVVQRARSRGRWKHVVVGGCCKASHALIARLRHRLQSVPAE